MGNVIERGIAKGIEGGICRAFRINPQGEAQDSLLAGQEDFGGLLESLGSLYKRQPEMEAQDAFAARSEQLEVEKSSLEAQIKEMETGIEKTKMEAAMTEMEKEKLRIEKLERRRATDKSRLGIDNVKKFNYAVTGQSGVGKSSLVNAFLGEEVAKVGIVECTSVVTSYPHPGFPNLLIWDMPGGGTVEHPMETYYEDKVLHAFDAVIIVTGDRILKLDLGIAKQSQEAGKPVVFLRSKADRDILNLAMDEGITMAEAADKFRELVHENFRKELLGAGLKGIDIVIVSSWLFFRKKSPYYFGEDQSLKSMDEELFMKFLLQTATTRFKDSDDQVRAIEQIFQGRVPHQVS